MTVMLVALAVLALAASAASTSYMAPPPRPQCPCQPQYPPTAPPPQPCPCQPPVGGCGVGGVPPPTPIINHCVEFLRQQCSPTTPTPQCSPQCQMHRQQCCQQLTQTEPLHRFRMVLQAVLLLQHQTHVGGPDVAVQIAQQMMEMCGLHQQPPTSPCPCAGGGIQY